MGTLHCCIEYSLQNGMTGAHSSSMGKSQNLLPCLAQVVLRAINSAVSACLAVTLEISFFEAFALGAPGQVVQAAMLIKVWMVQ